MRAGNTRRASLNRTKKVFANGRLFLKVKGKGRVAMAGRIPHVTFTLTKTGGTGLASGVGVKGREPVFLLWIGRVPGLWTPGARGAGCPVSGGRVPGVGRDTAVDDGSGASHFKLDGENEKYRGGRRWGG